MARISKEMGSPGVAAFTRKARRGRAADCCSSVCGERSGLGVAGTCQVSVRGWLSGGLICWPNVALEWIPDALEILPDDLGGTHAA